MLLAEAQRAVEERGLQLTQQADDVFGQALLRHKALGLLSGSGLRGLVQSKPSGNGDALLLHVFWSNLDPKRDALQLPLVEFEAGSKVVAIVHMEANSAAGPIEGDLLYGCHHVGTLGIGF